jgi:type IX secretion system PorP/SprF family membrane protein
MKLQIPFLCIGISLSLGLQAQQLPQSSLGQWNAFALNPAFAGIEQTMDARVGHRQQWVSFDGAPMSSWLTVNGTFGKQAVKPVQYGLHLSDPEIVNRIYEHAESKITHGWGLSAFYDKLGAFDRFQGSLAYALHLKLGKSFNWSIGPQIGLVNQGIRAADILLIQPDDPLYIQFVGNGNRITHFDAGIGTVLYGNSWWAGYAAQQLVGRRFYFGDQPTEAKLSIHHVIQIGKIFKLGEQTELQTYAIGMLTEKTPVNAEAGVKFRYNKTFWGGAAYRYNNSVALTLGVQITPCIGLAYAYDYPYSISRSNNLGTHELMLAFRPFNAQKRLNQFLW